MAGLKLGVGLSPQLTMLAALMAIAGVALALTVALARRVGLGALSPVVEPRLIRAALHIGIRLQPSSIALWLNLKIDLFLVGLLATTDEAGLYSLSASLADIVFTAVSTIALAALEAQTHAEEETAASYTLDFIGQNVAVAVLLGSGRGGGVLSLHRLRLRRRVGAERAALRAADAGGDRAGDRGTGARPADQDRPATGDLRRGGGGVWC